MKRYNIISLADTKLFQVNCPLILLNYALTHDGIQDSILLQCKFKNLYKSSVKEAYINVKCFDIENTLLSSIENYSYVLNDYPTDNIFGSNIPVYLPDNRTNHVEISCEKIIFNDDTIWKNEKDAKYETIPNDTFLSKIYTQGQIEQYILETGLNSLKAVYQPWNNNTIWQCTCGSYNLSSNDTCNQCNANIDTLIKKLDIELLNKNLQERRDIEHTRQQEKKQKNRKRLFKIGSVSIGLITIVVVVFSVIFNFFIPNNQYQQAISLMENKKYDQACEIFEKLGNFKYSNQSLGVAKTHIEAEKQYQKALTSFKNHYYNEAIERFEKLLQLDTNLFQKNITYTIKDQNNNILSKYTLTGFLDVFYYYGECLYQTQKYTDAKKNFELVNETNSNSEFVKKASERIDECNNQINYENGIDLVDKGDLIAAKKYFSQSDYNNSKDYLEIIDNIIAENWIGVYQQQEDNTEYLFVNCVLNDDLSYKYEFYFQNDFEEISVKDFKMDGGSILIKDELNDIDYTSSVFINKATYQFQPDKSVYKTKESAISGSYRPSDGYDWNIKEMLSRKDDMFILTTTINKIPEDDTNGQTITEEFIDHYQKIDTEIS